MNLCRPLAGPVCLATIILAVHPVRAQSAALSDLRAKSELTAADLRIVDDSIDQLITRLNDDLRDNKGKALERFNEALRDDINDSGNSPTFRNVYIERCAALCLQRVQNTPGTLSYILLDSLSGLQEVGTLDTFLAAVSNPDAAARFKGVAGIRRLSSALPADRVTEVIDVLKGQAIGERSSIVLGRLYGAIDFPTARDAQAAALVDILEARTDQDAIDPADLIAFHRLHSLAVSTLSSGDRARLARALATRLGSYVLTFHDLDPGSSARTDLQSLIAVSERLLTQVTGGTGGGAVETALSAGDAPGMLKGLQGWIGCGTESGKLNADPWQVPPGAGLEFDCPE